MTPAYWPGGMWPAGIWPGLMWPAPALTPAPLAPTTHLTAQTFPFKRNFPSLYDANGHAPAVDFAISVIEAEWSGIFEMFGGTSLTLTVNRQAMLVSYLVGWWLGDMYPAAMRGIQGDGGMPLSSKNIGGVSISRREIEAQPALVPLTSNAFGLKALSIILSRPERALILPRASVLPIAVTTWQEFASVLLGGGIPAP